jgi:hypothetical protein
VFLTHGDDVTLPARFIGAWERTGVVVDGAPVPDAGRVVWVEAGTAYVDVRGPGAFACDTTFAGLTTWDEPHLTWAHTIDAALDSGADVGLISYDGEDLIEDGEYEDGRVIRYSERWTRLPAGGGPVLAATTHGGIAVRVGDHASVVVDRRSTGGGIAARYERWDGFAWHPEIEFGDAVDTAGLPGPLAPGAEPPEGWSRT